MTGFSLAAAVGGDGGLVVVGSAPPDRVETLHRVALPLAGTARAVGDGLAWATLPGWHDREELQISTSSVLAQVTLEPLTPGTDLAGWTDVVFDRAPFLRDRRALGDRPVSVRGVDEATLHSFDWQPSGRGRVLTTVVTGTAGGSGFSLVVDVPFDGEYLFLDPDEVLALVDVRPVPPATPLHPAPVISAPPRPPVAPPPVAPPPPPPPATGPSTLPSVPSTVEFALPRSLRAGGRGTDGSPRGCADPATGTSTPPSTG